MSENMQVQLLAQESILINYQFLTRYRQAALILVHKTLLVSSQRTFSHANTMSVSILCATLFKECKGFVQFLGRNAGKQHINTRLNTQILH